MSFGQFLTILRARQALILFVALVVVAAVGAVTFMLPQQYQATARVLVDQRGAHSGAATAVSWSKPGDVVSTQIDVLTSPAVALRVVDRLKLEDRMDFDDLLAEPNALRRVWSEASRLFVDEKQDRPMNLKDWMATRLLRNLHINSNRDSFLVKITYTAPDPAFAAEVANAFSQGYLEAVQSLRADPAKKDAREFDGQLRGLRQELEQAEAKLAKFQQEKGIVAGDERMDLETGRLSEISAQLAMAQSQSYESQARQRQLREFLSSGGTNGAPGEVWSSPVVQQLRQGVAEREAKLSDMSKRMGPNHPLYKAAATELQQLRTQLNEEMRAAAQGALSNSSVAPQREGSLRGALEQQRARVLRMKNDRNTLAVLQREVDSARQAYDATAQRLTQSRIAGESGQSSGTIVNLAAVPTQPIGPKPVFNLALALMGGLILGIGFALACESFDGYVRSERDILQIIDVPVMATISRKGHGRPVHRLPGPNIYPLPHA